MAAARACIWETLSLARSRLAPASFICGAESGDGLVDPHLRLRRGVGGLDRLLLDAEGGDPFGEASLVLLQLGLLLLQ